MAFVTGALGTLLPKLAQLLKDEYDLQKGVRKNIKFLCEELESIHAALRDVGEVPREQLTELVKIWARDARELSYDMEDVVDTFLVRVQGPDGHSKSSAKRFIEKMFKMLTKGTIRHQIGKQIENIKERVKEVADRRDRYKFDMISPARTSIDPRITALYTKASDLVGIDEAREELITLLTKGEHMSVQQQKIVSIVGFGGLGKTTLARAVQENLKEHFDCTAFVSVSQKPDLKRFFMDMLYELDKRMHMDICNTEVGEKQLIDLIRECLQNKRYFIIIDDIWDISYWDIIRCALPDGNDGHRVITTTRDFTVAGYIGGAYKMKSLSPENSRILMYGRVFGKEHEHKCPNEHLVEVSDKILKKCAGVPLAIITIASLLASKGGNKLVWDDVCKSIGTGLEKNSTIENMRNILSFSYYDMPPHLRTCLLYLSMFPEDYIIRKNRLIRLWMAEGFIQSEKQEKSLFEMGENYFNELVNRSMIQPIVHLDHYSEIVDSCRVHDMMLDLIRSLSSEENFVTIWNEMGHISASEKDRRLCLQNGKGKPRATMSMEHARSVVAFPSAIGLIPALRSFRVLRVLDLEGCNLPQGYNLKYFKNLLHLRYVSLAGCKRSVEILEEIENLKFLQTLDLRDTGINILPPTIIQLRHLVCLNMDRLEKVPKGIGSLTSLEVLPYLLLDYSTRDTIFEELGQLTELRRLELNIFLHNKSTQPFECLNKLKKLQSLKFNNPLGEYNVHGWDVALPQLHTLKLLCWLSALPPAWANPSHLVALSFLEIRVRKVQQEDFEILGRLPSLCHLDLRVDHMNLGIIADTGSFQCLVNCRLWSFGCPVVFREGAMPKLTYLWLGFQLREMRKINGSFDLGLGNLPSLQDGGVWLGYEGAHEEVVAEVEAVLRHAIDTHPNNPSFGLYDEVDLAICC